MGPGVRRPQLFVIRFSTTEYGGDRVTVTPPEGGTTTTTITDGRDRTVEVQQHTPTGVDTTSYAYTPAGQLAEVKDPGDNTWSYEYDLRGRKTAETDPDRGHTTYDKVGNRVTETQYALSGDISKTYAYTGHTLDSVTTTHPGGTNLDTYDYDPTGNTTSRALAGDDQTLEWDAEGHLAKVTENSQETSYVYTADGDRLIRRDPDAVTLFLGNQEVRLDRESREVSATRYYEHAGRTVAVRTESGVSWLASDHNGTGEITIDAASMQVNRRRHLPFGEPRGTAPSAWLGQRGFVGGTLDTSTGLTHLGAREYDPTVGRFLSVDPIMDLADPQQMHGYTYANNNPATFTDPDGLYPICGGGAGGDCAVEGPIWQSNPSKAQIRSGSRSAAADAVAVRVLIAWWMIR
ncbi:RHS repeat-associated core domain-containing protein [Actinophytocola sp.]|uniref:RHS repeat-associated core domain-containing protein n=1 Tax=Actinophytocola sp. TaxID=1872138 RepID=UPI0025C61555|nr:RHS repeat-associated core domain-containing protein [Actinophytocola sp.]